MRPGLCPSVLPGLGALCGVLALAGAGGPGCRERPDAVDAGEPSGGAPRAAAPRMEVKVPLPTGWSARPPEEGVARFGPAHRPVLRVDLRSGEGAALPTAEALTQLVARAFRGLERLDEQREEGEDYVLVRLSLAPRLGDGGVGERHPAFFGARRVEKNLFLCASLPGASADEVREAASACVGLHVQPAR